MYVSMLTQFRRSLAGWFGRKEHFSGELLGVVLVFESVYWRDWRFFVPCGVWLVYFLSHRLEKKIYGRVGWRQ